jgi:2-oxoglutarate/2-oxoacid ferredoxin oxidoreductase subunit alpha
MKRVMQGNEAAVTGFLNAGVDFFAGYPITPSNEFLLHFLKNKIGLQVEDEISAINMAIGASLAGKKALVATSGPGFSLMQEGIGYALMVEVPLVIANVQRGGPATGMPTMPSQADIYQSRYGSHGDVWPIVFYPNSVAELYEYAIIASNAAEESCSPVVLLSDAYLSRMVETIEIGIKPVKLKRRKLEPLGKGGRHFTGLTHKNWIPESDNLKVHAELVEYLTDKINAVGKKYPSFSYSGNKESDTLIVCYGFVSRLISFLKEKHAFFRPIRIWPFLDTELENISKKYKRIVVVEANSGQLVREVERVTKKEVEFVSLLDYRDIDMLTRRI